MHMKFLLFAEMGFGLMSTITKLSFVQITLLYNLLRRISKIDESTIYLLWNEEQMIHSSLIT
jgi:hypothetical protein